MPDPAAEGLEQVARGVFRLRTLFVNVYFVGDESRARPTWTLIDTGFIGYAASIRKAGERLFGTRPSAILLTHGHFDHVGNVSRLADEWQVPVYVHPLELPYVTGTAPYPPARPLNGGLMAWTSPLLPRGPIDLDGRVRMLPENGDVPSLNEWQWIATPGHTAGHVSFVRDADRTLLAGDAVVTTKQEYATSVVAQRQVVWRPPAYFTADWDAAWASVRTLAAYEPDVLATGHGHSMQGDEMRRELHELADHFDEVIPDQTRRVPWAALAGAAAATGLAIALRRRTHAVRRP